ncbi:MAG: hypothetical protein PHN80_00115 [Hespellia sp.]|nr:hypothetical protein [Hespellia sp.]
MEKITEVKCVVKSFLDREWTMGEKVLLIADCILFGIVLGAIWSPKRNKRTVMGSYNSGNGCSNDLTEDWEDQDWEDEDWDDGDDL